MLIPLHVQLDMYDGDRDDDSADLVQLFEMVLVIPKNDASVTKALISRELDGIARVVRVRQGGFKLGADLRDQFLIETFLYLHSRMRKGSGTGYDWWATSVGDSLAGKLSETELAEIVTTLSAFVTPESHVTEHSVTRLSRW